MHNSKGKDKLDHATITLQHSYSAPRERVFSEFADPLARARWSAPSNDELVYDEADFQIGGKDVFQCGPKGDPKLRGETAISTLFPIPVSFQGSIAQSALVLAHIRRCAPCFDELKELRTKTKP
jgi:hypothetical protein